MSGTHVYNIDSKSEISPSEYLAALRALHVIRCRQAKNTGCVDDALLETLRLLELHCPCSSHLKNLTNLLYNS